jgi:membrane-associated phospholipid phosphatase
VLTTLVVVGTGNHYLLDVFAGVAVAVVAALLTGLIGPRRDAEKSPQGFQFDVSEAR